jgi:uncharacterized membrane protein YidH (DUF202 family)
VIARDGTGYDRGLATERTNLAWNRTCLALGALAMLSLRLAIGEVVVAVLLTGVGVAASMLLLVHARGRYRALPRTVASGRAVVDPSMLAALAAVTAVFGIFVIVAVVAAE